MNKDKEIEPIKDIMLLIGGLARVQAGLNKVRKQVECLQVYSDGQDQKNKVLESVSVLQKRIKSQQELFGLRFDEAVAKHRKSEGYEDWKKESDQKFAELKKKVVVDKEKSVQTWRKMEEEGWDMSIFLNSSK